MLLVSCCVLHYVFNVMLWNVCSFQGWQVSHAAVCCEGHGCVILWDSVTHRRTNWFYVYETRCMYIQCWFSPAVLPLFGCISVIVMTSCCCWSQCTSLLFPCSLCLATWCPCAPPSNMWFLANKCLSPVSSAVFMAHQCARHTPHTQETMQCATSVAIGNICAVGPNNLLLIFLAFLQCHHAIVLDKVCQARAV